MATGNNSHRALPPLSPQRSRPGPSRRVRFLPSSARGGSARAPRSSSRPRRSPAPAPPALRAHPGPGAGPAGAAAPLSPPRAPHKVLLSAGGRGPAAASSFNGRRPGGRLAPRRVGWGAPRAARGGGDGGAAGLVVRRGEAAGPLGNFLLLSVPSGGRWGPSRERGAAAGIALGADSGGRPGRVRGGRGERGQPRSVSAAALRAPDWRNALLQC